MTILTLGSGPLTLRITPTAGAIVDAHHAGRPILRPYPGAGETPERSRCASFPLVPFGNRIEAGRFTFEGRKYHLPPNAPEPHPIHGDGWQATWDIVETAPASATLAFTHEDNVYAYRAEQVFRVEGDRFAVTLQVENTGPRAMPFGLGHHPYFPLTPETLLTAPAHTFVAERAGHLPGERLPLPEDTDFAKPSPIPPRWLNNGFEGWTGDARIVWPEAALAVRIAAPEATGYFLFRPDTAFDPAYRGDYFCFEPMTHAANAHNLPGGGGLRRLTPGERMSLTMTLIVEPT